jgi:hypothetical protein
MLIEGEQVKSYERIIDELLKMYLRLKLKEEPKEIGVDMSEITQKEVVKERELMFDELLPPYGITKCVQVMKYITKNLSNLDIYDVFKILYIADKIHLLEYNKLIAPDKYIKKEYGPILSRCYNILKFVQGIDYKENFDKSIKEELRVNIDDKIYCLKDPDMGYLSKSNVKCLNKAIKVYKNGSSEDLKKEDCDEIYDSVDFNEEITKIHMANVLDKSGELTDYLENY